MGIAVTGIDIIKSKSALDEDSLLDVIRRAFGDSHIIIGKNINANHVGIFMGSTLSNFSIRKNNIDRYYNEPIREASPAEVPKNLLSYLGGYFSIELNLQGASSTLSSGYSSGIDALIHALCFLRRHRLNKAVVIELEEQSKISRLGDITGACCLILENSSAIKRKKCYGVIEAVEAFFEKEEENYGLSQAINKIIGEHLSSFRSINFIIGGLSAFSDGLKFKNNLNYFSKASSVIFFMNLGHNSNSSCGIIRIPKAF